jgi:ATP-binding protein involved in chromosome partitioning
MMFKQVNVEVLGIIENMSFFICPHCSERSEIFSHGGGEVTSQRYGVPFLGGVPLEISVREGGDSGKPIVLSEQKSPASLAFQRIAQQFAARVSTVSFDRGPVVQLED